MKRVLTLVLIAAFAVAAGCGDKKEDKPATPPAEPVVTPPTPEPAPEPEVSDEDLPVAPDFEDEAEAEITDKNFEKELDKLAAEIEEAG